MLNRSGRRKSDNNIIDGRCIFRLSIKFRSPRKTANSVQINFGEGLHIRSGQYLGEDSRKYQSDSMALSPPDRVKMGLLIS